MIQWETITRHFTQRLKVPLGWLVRTTNSMAFVFDPFHWWKIETAKL